MRLFILALVVWRLSYMLTEERCPWDLCKKLRKATKKLKFLDLTCFYCISVVVSLFLFITRSVGFYEALALSTMAIFIETIHRRLE